MKVAAAVPADGWQVPWHWAPMMRRPVGTDERGQANHTCWRCAQAPVYTFSFDPAQGTWGVADTSERRGGYPLPAPARQHITHLTHAHTHTHSQTDTYTRVTGKDARIRQVAWAGEENAPHRRVNQKPSSPDAAS